MNFHDFTQLLKLQDKVLSITRTNTPELASEIKGGCTIKAINHALKGETIIFSPENAPCKGSATGFGFTDGLPPIPGGFGNFIAQGKGEGFPPGERLKCSPEIAEQMLLSQPQNVMEGFSTVELKPYEETDAADTVTILANADQLSALITLYNYRKSSYDKVIAPMSSGCASIFRIPFGELKNDEPRAVISNVDIFSRPHFDKDSFFFTVSNGDFVNMLNDADDSFLITKIWKNIENRI